jgi:hypothetical protein
MSLYLLSVIEPDGEMPAPEVLASIMRDVAVVEKELRAQDALVFNGGLHPPRAARTVRVKNAKAHVTDGPFMEAKEHIGGFMIVKAPDLDAALAWARKLAGAIPLPIEVRAFRE